MNDKIKRMIKENLDLLNISSQERTNLELLFGIVYQSACIEGIKEAQDIYEKFLMRNMEG